MTGATGAFSGQFLWQARAGCAVAVVTAGAVSSWNGALSAREEQEVWLLWDVNQQPGCTGSCGGDWCFHCGLEGLSAWCTAWQNEQGRTWDRISVVFFSALMLTDIVGGTRARSLFSHRGLSIASTPG